MAINKKLISFATQAQFDLKLNAGDIDNRSIVFIEDKKRIWTHGVYFDTSWDFVTGTPDTYTPSAHTLASHSDVTITSNSDGEILRWNGTNWINNTLSEAGIASTGQLSNYLPLAGGTLTGSSYNMLELKRSSANGSSMLFSNSSVNLGKIGFTANGNLIIGTGASTDGVANMLSITPSGVVQFYGNISTSGLVTGTGFSKTGATDTHVLLGSGGHKAISDFNASLVTSTANTGTTNVATSNTNTYLNIVQGGSSVGSSTQIVGSNGVTVASDTTGKLTITGLGAHAGVFSSRANGSGASSNSIESKDTRSTNPLPSTDLQRGVWFDFKTNSAIGLTGASTYSSVITMVPYGDNSGNSNASFRLAQSGNNLYFQNWTTVWGTWNKVWHSGNLTNLNQLTTRNFSDLQNKPTTLSGYGITSLTFPTVGGLTPYIGNMGSDGTFGMSIEGTTYQSGLAIGGASKNLLWKGGVVYHAGNIPTWNQSTTGNAATASAVTLTADNSTNATRYPLFVDAATGNKSPRTDTGFTYNPSTGALTTISFVGNLTGNANTANYLSYNGTTDLDAVTNTGVYRQEQPSSGYPYTSTLNMRSSDGRQQLTISRDGSGMKFRGVNSGSGTTGWTAWKEVYHTGNFANGTTSQYIRGDGSLATYANTTYSEITEAEINTGTASTLRTITGRRLKYAFDNITAANADTLDGYHASSLLKDITTNYGTTITSANNYPTDLLSGIHRTHVSNVEYASILTGYDYNGKYWQLRFRPTYGREIYYRNNASTAWSVLAFTDSNITGNAATASKLGTATVGSTQLPFYLNAGTATAITQANLRKGLFGTTAIGSTTRPIYIAANGVPTAITGSIANSTTGNAATATNLASITTTFTGKYPVTVNVNGTIYSHTGITFTGSTGTLATTTFAGNLTGLASLNLPLAGGTMTGILTAQNNTSYTTKQVRNIILSPSAVNGSAMANGDIWITYE